MTRWKAAGTHLALSIVVIGGIALAAFLLWYPYALYRVAGLDRILLVMLAIDLTAGPLLTLILYRKGKRGLKFDLTVVAICQIAFLTYGLNTLWQGRPVFLVGTPDTFTLVFANEIDDADLAEASRPEWRRLSWTGPQLVGARMPEDPDARRDVIEAFMAGGAGIERSPGRYMPYEEVAPNVLAQSEAYSGDESRSKALRIMPVVSRRAEGQLLIDATSAMPVRTIRSVSSTQTPI